MKKRAAREYRRLAIALVLATVTMITLNARVVLAASASEIDRNATEALRTLYASTPGALNLAKQAKGVLVFPNIVKAGFIVGGQYGDGVLAAKGARRSGTIDPSPPRMAYRPVCNPSATSCCSWMMRH